MSSAMYGQHRTRLAWDPAGEPVSAKDADVVEGLLLDLHQQFSAAGRPTLVLLDREGEDTSLRVGLGGRMAMLCWLRPGDPAEDMISLGSEDGSAVSFRYAGRASTYPASVLVDVEPAIEAARTYAATGERPDNVEWQRT